MQTAAPAKPSLLFLAHLLPWPLDGGGQIKSYHTLRILSSEYDVTLLAFIRRPEEAENIAPLQAFCRDIQTVLLPRSKASNAMAALTALAQSRSFIISRDEAPAMREAVKQALGERKYDAIHVDHLQMMPFVPERRSPARIVLDQHNIEHRIPKRMAETASNSPLLRWYAAREWPKLRDFEIAACRRADRVLTVSDEDRDGLRALLGADPDGKFVSVPIGVDTDYFGTVARAENSKTLLSIGTMYWPPNVDAMTYFCADILPKIKESVPDVRVNIVGARPTPAVQALAEADSAVTVTGLVPDVRPWAADCGAFIVPLRSGSGMRVKILNAMAMGLPVVSTTLGAEGIDVTHGKDILIADGAQAFADATLRLLSDPALARQIAAGGRRLMEERYSWNRVGERLLSVYEAVVPQEVGAAPR